MARWVIVGGADVNNYDAVKSFLKDDDFMVYCDCGLKHMEALERPADLVLGDFDSHPKPHTAVETIVLPVEKDDTDSVFAAKEGIRRGYSDIVLVGAVGGTLDHTMANISILLWLDEMGANAVLIDDYSQMEIVSSGKSALVEDTYDKFSVVAMTPEVTGVYISDAKYTLDDGVIQMSYQYAVRNEPIPGKTARVTVGYGKALLIKIWK